MKKVVNEDGTVTIDFARDFSKFLWKSRFLLWALSIDREFTFKEKIKIYFTGRM